MASGATAPGSRSERCGRPRGITCHRGARGPPPSPLCCWARPREGPGALTRASSPARTMAPNRFSRSKRFLGLRHLLSLTNGRDADEPKFIFGLSSCHRRGVAGGGGTRPYTCAHPWPPGQSAAQGHGHRRFFVSSLFSTRNPVKRRKRRPESHLHRGPEPPPPVSRQKVPLRKQLTDIENPSPPPTPCLPGGGGTHQRPALR